MFTGEFDCPKVLVELTAGAQAVNAGDLDGDGLEDLVFTQTDTEVVFVAWSEGAGAFTVSQLLGSVPAARRGAQLVDINGDQLVDILVPSNGQVAGANPPQVLMNQGGRTFAASMPIPGINSPARELDAADLDGDGDPDLVIRNVNDSRHFYRNQQGTFQFVSGLAANGTVNPTIALVDVDGDGDIDVFSVREQFSSQTVLLINENLDGNGTFATPVGQTVSGRDVVVADVDGDGLPDIVACNRSADPPLMRRSTGNFAFDSPTFIQSEIVGGVTEAMATDLNGDGVPDIVLTVVADPLMPSEALRLIRSDASGVFPPFVDGVVDLSARIEGAAGISTADFDLDGDIDVVAGSNDKGVYFAAGLGFGDFAGAKPVPEANGLNVKSTLAADLNDDGASDIVVRTDEGDLMWLAGGGNGTFGAPALIGSLGSADGLDPHLVDLDLDGDLDVLGVRSEGLSVLAWDQTSPGVFAASREIVTSARPILALGFGDIDGAGGFLQGQSVAISTGVVRTLAIADLDLDGDQDLAWNNTTSQRLEGAENSDGAGAFGALLDLAPGDSDGGLLEVVDVIGTSHPDILLRVDLRTVQVVRSLGSFTYAPPVSSIVESSLLSDIATLDVDSDGDLDVLATVPGDGRLEWFSNLDLAPPGQTYCSPAVKNSTDRAGVLSTVGSDSASENNLTLRVSRLPGSALTLLLTSQTSAVVPNAGTSVGTLCLGGSIGRFAAPAQVQVTTPDGTAALTVDLTQLPQPMGTASAMDGAVWYFQAWFRDSVGGQATSNFTDGSSVTFTM